jgi:TatD DNase family protein
MLKYPFVDIHTHSEQIPGDVVTIRNVFYNDALSYKFENDRFYSVGLHPWFIRDDEKTFKIKILEEIASRHFVLAIGETGLDSMADAEVELQTRVFEMQLFLANKLRKPVIVHCENMISHFISMVRKNFFKVPVIFHGYNFNIQDTTELIRKNCYFSFGSALLKDNSDGAEILGQIPKESIFFETDESGMSIGKIYEAAAQILNTSTDQLKSITGDNFKRCFFPEVK